MSDEGYFEARLGLFLGLLIPTVFAIEHFSLPGILLDAYMTLGISFLISGLFYDLFEGLGLGFLDGITIVGYGGISALNIIVVITKGILGL